MDLDDDGDNGIDEVYTVVVAPRVACRARQSVDIGASQRPPWTEDKTLEVYLYVY